MVEIADLYPLIVKVARFFSNRCMRKSAFLPTGAEDGPTSLSLHQMKTDCSLKSYEFLLVDLRMQTVISSFS